MKKFGRRLVGAFFNLEWIIAIGGILLSVAAHELFHIMIHFGEIDSIHIFPDAQAIVEVIFTPSAEYNLALEEAIAYGITMISLLLTTMLIGDIHDAKNSSSAYRSVIGKKQGKFNEDSYKAEQHLALILGIEPATQTF